MRARLACGGLTGDDVVLSLLPFKVGDENLFLFVGESMEAVVPGCGIKPKFFTPI